MKTHRCPNCDHDLSDFIEEVIEELLVSIDKKVDKLIMDLTALSAAVAAETDVVTSVITLLDQLAAEVQAAAGDPVALQAAVDTIKANSAALAADVAKNTPAAP